MKDRLNRLGLNVIAVLVAAIFAGGVTSLILAVRGDSPSFVISQMWDFGTQAATEVTILNTATYYYLSAIAVAIGFRMNLFNIGVDGQYQLATCLAAAFGGSVALPNGLRQFAIVVVAMLVGAAWAGLVGAAEGDPRRQRGHLLDHAELHRHRSHRVPDAAQPARRAHRQQRHHDQADPGLGPGAGPRPHLRRRHEGVRADRARRRRRHRLPGRRSATPGSASTCARPGARCRRPRPAASTSRA